MDSGVEAHGQRAGRPGWVGGGLVTAGPERVSRGQLTEGQGPWRLPGDRSVGSAGGESRERARGVPRDGRPGEGWKSTTAAGDGPPRGGRVSPPSWARGRTPGLAVPGRARRGQAQRGERGSPTRRCLIGNPDPTRVRQGARGATCLEPVGPCRLVAIPATVAGRGGKPPRREGTTPRGGASQGPVPPSKGAPGVPGAPQSLPVAPCRPRGVPEAGESRKGWEGSRVRVSTEG